MTKHSFSTHMKVVTGEALIASVAATLSVLVLDVPVWAMFVGWISFFTRGLNVQHSVINLACVLIGVILGMGAAQALAALAPILGRSEERRVGERV